MRVDWLRKNFVLSVLLISMLMLLQFAKCDDNKNQQDTKEVQNLKAPLKSSLPTSKTTASSSSVPFGEPRQRYQLKFLTPYTSYPIRLKDHYGRKGNTRWHKYFSQNFTDEIPNGFSIEDEYSGTNKASHLLITGYDTKTNFMLDHFEPRHQDATLKSSNQVYDYDYAYENNIEREIYTLVYLTDFQLLHVQANSTIDNVNQVYTDVTCRVSLLIPSAINDEHSAILNEHLEKAMHLRLKLIDPNVDESNAPSQMAKDKRNISFKPLSNSQEKQQQKNETVAGKSGENSARYRRNANANANADVNGILYEMQILEGPIRVFRENFKDGGLNASCSLSLRDFDGTFAYNSFISSTIFSTKSSGIKSSSVSAMMPSGRFSSLLFVSSIFVAILVSTRSILA